MQIKSFEIVCSVKVYFCYFDRKISFKDSVHQVEAFWDESDTNLQEVKFFMLSGQEVDSYATIPSQPLHLGNSLQIT